MNLRRNALLTTALTGVWLAAASVALAQTADAPVATAAGAKAAPAAAPVLDEVVVTGIRKSIQKSLDVKKRSDDVVEVVTAEAIGKFPDTNLAESLSHLPGVSVDRQFGEGDRVSIDGTDPRLNRVFIDGHSIASADWGGDPQDTGGRNFNYSYISPDIISQLELFKNPEARLDEGSIGGTVEVDTRKPLDLDANTIFVSGGYKYNDRSAQGDSSASLAYSWKNADNNFGVIVAYSHNDEHLTRSGIEYFGYSNGTDFLGGKTPSASTGIVATSNPGMTINGQAPTLASEEVLAGARYPAYINFAYFQQTRDRDSVSGTMSWKPVSNFQVDFSALYIGGNYNNLNQSAYSYNVQTSRATNVVVNNGLVTQGTYASGPASGVGSNTWNGELDEYYRVTNISNQSYDMAYKWDVDGFHISGDAGYSRATGGKQPEYGINWRTASGFTYGFNGQNTNLNWATAPTNPGFWQTEYNQAIQGAAKSSYNPVVPGYNNGQSFPGFQIGGEDFDTYTDGEWYGKADFEHDVSWGPIDKILFGGKYSTHENSNVDQGTNTYAPVSGGDFTVGTLSNSITPSGLFNGLGATGNATQFSALTSSQVIKALNSEPTVVNTPNFGGYFDVVENITAAYVQGDFKGERYHGNFGVRIVDTSDRSQFYNTVNANNQYVLTDVTHDYINALPSFNIAYDAAKDVVFHAGVAEVMARSAYSDLAGAYSISTSNPGAGVSTLPGTIGLAGTGSEGNPDLKPYQSLDYEVTAEWYFKPRSLLSGELFYRDIQNYVLETTKEVILSDPHDENIPGSYDISTPLNAGKASVEGFSLIGNYDIAWGFGFESNYTFSSAQTSNGYNLPFLSRDVFNFIPYYENGPWQIRVPFNYRSEYFTGIGRLGSSDSTDRYRELDTQISYRFTPKISLVFDASNLLDETYYSYSTTKSAPTGIYKNGRVFGLRFSFRQ